jgi:hypothetical protein
MTRIYLIDGLSILDAKLGHPRAFWPAVMFIIFIVAPCVASALDGALQ